MTFGPHADKVGLGPAPTQPHDPKADPEPPAQGARITSMSDYQSCLQTFQRGGHSEIDTARVYVGGAQEAFTRAAGYEGMGFSIATKCYPRAPQTHEPAALRRCLETSLEELGAACVDIFYLHAADRATPFEETLAEVDKMHKEGPAFPSPPTTRWCSCYPLLMTETQANSSTSACQTSPPSRWPRWS